MALIVKTRIDPHALVSQVRAAVAAIDPEQPMADVRTMDEWMARSLEGRRAPMLLLALFGAVALTLSAIGIYGVLAFGVAQRAREFGIRQALGAEPRAILSLVLGQGMRTAGIGVAARAGRRGRAHALPAEPAVRRRRLRSLRCMPASPSCCSASRSPPATCPARRATRVAPTVALRES